MSPQKWIKATNAIGIVSKARQYNGGTFSHSDLLNVALFGQTAKEWRKDYGVGLLITKKTVISDNNEE